MELIQVSKECIGNQDAVNAVNARELHAKLEVRTRFNDWIRRAIDRYGFEENISTAFSQWISLFAVSSYIFFCVVLDIINTSASVLHCIFNLTP